MFSYPHCKYTRPIDGSMFIRLVDIVLTKGMQGSCLDLVLIKWVDMGFKWMFSDPHCSYIQDP